MSLFPPYQPNPLGPLYGPEHACTDPPEPAPTQEDMDKLASALTEAVLLLRAGDMEGVRGVLIGASGLCGVKISNRNPLSTVPDHYVDAARYGMGVYKSMQAPLPPTLPARLTATETLHRQKEAEQRVRLMSDAMADVMATDFLKKIKGAF